MASDRDGRARIVLRPLGTPLALGLVAILLGTTMLSGVQLGWFDGAAEQRTVAFVAAFRLELLAATLCFLARDRSPALASARSRASGPSRGSRCWPARPARP